MIPRTLAGEFARLSTRKAITLCGPRGVGKSTIIEGLVAGTDRHLIPGNSLLAAKALDFTSPADITNFLLQSPTIIIENAQCIPEIGLIVKMLADANQRLEKPARLLVTTTVPFAAIPGTESALGRLDTRPLWPVSLGELAQATSPAYVANSLGRHLVYGLMPEVLEDIGHAQKFLSNYCEGTLLSDVMDLYPIRHRAKMRDLLSVLALRVGQILS